jgi:hypothetical protein
MDGNTNLIRVLIVEPQKQPYVKDIENDFRAMQAVVGGPIEYLYLTDDAHIYCNEEGKLLGLTGNRRMDNGDVIAGTFFICGDNGYGEDISLTDEQVEQYTERFKEQEYFSYKEMDNMIFARVKPAFNIDDFLAKMEFVQDDEEDLEL